jgi:hypothetical protein
VLSIHHAWYVPTVLGATRSTEIVIMPPGGTAADKGCSDGPFIGVPPSKTIR